MHCLKSNGETLGIKKYILRDTPDAHPTVSLDDSIGCVKIKNTREKAVSQ
jgi:hypothetical protein